MDTMNQLQTIDFNGDQIEALQDASGAVWAPLKRLAGNLGIAWTQDQIDKVKSDGAMRYEAILIPSAGGPQQAFCLHLDSIPGWLFSIRTAAVAEDVRPKLIEYKKRCHAVLREHFFGAPRPDRSRLSSAFVGYLEALADQVEATPRQYAVAVVRAQRAAEASLTGQRDPRATLPFPEPAPHDENGRYLDEVRVQAIALYEAGGSYRGVADAVGVNAMQVHRWVRAVGKARPRPICHPEEVRAHALQLIADGVGLRETARRLGIGHTTVNRWYSEAQKRPRTHDA